MAGLNEAGIDEVFASRPKPNPAAQPGALGMERADAIRGEIYRRHRISPDTPLADAMKQIEQRSQMRSALGVDGGQPSAWANPEERARAREEYAMQGQKPADVQKRWDDSTHLLDPRTYQYMQNFGRDLDFLGSEQQQEEAASRLKTPRRMLDANAIRHYEGSDGERLSGVGGISPFAMPRGYQRFDTVSQAAMDNMSNPDVPLGNYMQASETVPNYLRMQGSSESDTSSESWRRAQSARLANNRYRLTSPHAILDLPEGASGKDISRRIAELQAEVGSAGVPFADERWQRMTGWTPPGWLSDAGDFAISMIDPTVAIPAARGVGALTNAARAGLMASKIAGTGWAAPAIRSAVGPTAANFGWDMASEQAMGSGIQGSLGGIPGRSDRQFWMGGGKPGVDFAYKTDEQVEEARRAGDQLHARLKDDDGVSRADSEAYNRLVATGLLPQPGSDLHPRPQWRMNSSNKQ
jgi:hypothetical protein